MVVARVLVATADGLHHFDAAGGPVNVEHAGRPVTAIAPEGWELWAVLEGSELWHTAGIEWWFHVTDFTTHRGNCIADTRAGVVIGASEARLFRVAGEGVERIDSFDEIAGRSEWFTPWGGPPDTRSLAEDHDTVYANVHVGGIVRSRDHGQSWEPTIEIRADVHQVRTARGRVLAATARGLAISHDQGDTWGYHTEGLEAEYCRAVAPCGEYVLLSASHGPQGGDAAVYRCAPDGGRLERCRTGLPDAIGGNIDTYWLDALPGGELAAIGIEGGGVYTSLDQGATWRQLASDLPEVHALLVLP